MPHGPLWRSGHHFEKTSSLLSSVTVAFLIKSTLHFSEVTVAKYGPALGLLIYQPCGKPKPSGLLSDFLE